LLLLGWTAIGLGIAALPTQPRGLRATFLAVGHGSAILVEFPNGKTLLFDAGALDDGERAFRVVRTALWRRGITRLDAVVLSHADLDHVNAIPDLAKEIPVGTVMVARSFFQSRQAVVPYLVGEIKGREIPLRAIGKGDRLALDPSVTVEVKHPDPRTNYAQSNANSLAIRFTHAGRSLLLVGDVEREGLIDLMSHDPGQVDVFQSPHHGSPTANTPELVKWANPRIVVVSGGYVPGRMQELTARYGSSARLLSTFHDGAVTVDISRNGHLLVESHIESD
jgi:competence protein ComEC